MKNKILVADKYFLDDKKYDLQKIINVFPMSKDDFSYRSSLENLKKRSELQSKFFNNLYPLFKNTSNQKLGYKNNEFNIVYNQIIVRLSSIFFDHLIRVNHIIKNNKFKYQVQMVDDIDLSSSHSNLNNFNSSWQFNQMIIMKISNILDVENINYINKSDFPELKNIPKSKNLIFAPYGSTITNINRRLTTIYIIISKLLGRLTNRKNKILSAGFSSDEFYFAKRGAYGPFGFMIRIDDNKPKIISKKKNTFLRNEFKSDIYLNINKIFKSFINELGQNFENNKIEKIYNLWLDLIIDSVPVFLFEDLNFNIENYKTYLNKNYFKKYLIGEPCTLIDNDSGILLSLACKRMGGILIGMQHSAGHFGYIDDLSFGNYFEYNHYDKYYTFGWTKTNDYLPKSQFTSMPCPKLSSFVFKKNNNNLRDFNKKRDILFLSNTISRYPMGGTCGHSRIDFIDDILDNQKQLIDDLIKNKFSIIHKPYNLRVTKLFDNHFKYLESKYSNSYRLLNINQKGLTNNLISSAKILLWDQIGSGTVEAFANKIPSIIYWKRIYSQEAPWSKTIIQELQKCGVLHDNTESLIIEVKKYISDPKKWINNKNRILAIKSFCNSYANYDINWYNNWKQTIVKLSNEY